MLINFKMELSKIDKSKIYTSVETGRKYIDLSIWVEDEKDPATGKRKTDQFGNNAGAHISQTKEERESQTPRIYVGNGKVFEPTTDNGPTVPYTPPAKDEDDDLPF